MHPKRLKTRANKERGSPFQFIDLITPGNREQPFLQSVLRKLTGLGVTSSYSKLRHSHINERLSKTECLLGTETPSISVTS